MKLKFIEVETAVKIKLCKLLEQLNQRHNRAETVMDSVDDAIVDSEEQDLSTQFLQMRKNQLIALQEDFERTVMCWQSLDSTAENTISI